MKTKTYYLLYKITNKLNGMIYIGVHKTLNKKDGYMGSGKLIQRAIKKHGIENFKKTILKECKSQKELFLEESLIVNKEFVKRKDTYNLTLGGKGSWYSTKGTATAKDKDGNFLKVSIKDPRYLSGELENIAKGLVTVKDKKGNFSSVSVNDPRYLSGELKHNMVGLIQVKDKKGIIKTVSINDPRYLSGELIYINKGKIVVKDANNKCFQVDKNDPRINKTLFFIWKGKKHSEETKKKIGKTNSLKLKGINKGKFWIYNLKEKKSIRIFKKELDFYLSKNWIKGRKIKFS